jgi:hypothetical protein
MTFAPMDPDLDPDDLDIDISESSEPEIIESFTSTVVEAGQDGKHSHGVESGAPSEAGERAHEAARMESLEKLQGGAGGNAGVAVGESPTHPDRERGGGIVKLSWKRGNASALTRHQQMSSNPEAVIVLKEEKV